MTKISNISTKDMSGFIDKLKAKGVKYKLPFQAKPDFKHSKSLPGSIDMVDSKGKLVKMIKKTKTQITNLRKSKKVKPKVV